MDITKTLYVKKRKDWRDWLKNHYKTEKEIWLVYYKIQSGKPRIPYEDAVEEALCFGWIDSTVKPLDDERYAQRFSPRNPKSAYSQPNKERLRMLARKGRVAKDVLASLGNILKEKFKVPPDILQAIKADPRVWKNFQSYPKAYQRIRIAFVDGSRKRPEEFKKRLNYFIKMTGQNKQIGFGIDKFLKW
jgi:uncharacterized protein YdeI (YjbR/CyaY-like superfamily)